MGSIIDWAKRKFAIAAIALSNVEKNALGQNAKQLTDDVNHVKRNTEGQLMDSLINGVVTQEVKDLRWRTYKVLNEMSKVGLKISGYEYDDKGEKIPLFETYYKDMFDLSTIKIDPTDDYPLEMVYLNKHLTSSLIETLENTFIKNVDDVNVISGEDYVASHTPPKPIYVGREFHPKFKIETFSDKLNIRKINDEKRLIEFCVNKYQGNDGILQKSFIKEIQKAMVEPSKCNMLEIKELGFITDNTIGVDDLLEFKYENLVFDKITVFEEFYLIKFIGEVTINGSSIVEQYKEVELDEKYRKKERR